MTLGAIGILGGTFDPVHRGHLAVAREALRELELERVLFVPNAISPFKQGQAVTPAEHREAMVSLAIADDPDLFLSRLELDRPGPSFTVDTVSELAARSRAEGRPEPWFILSAEVLEDFDRWREPERILAACRIAVAPRPGAEPIDRAWLERRFPGRHDRFAILPGPRLAISATLVRERVGRDEPIDDLVPPAVGDYIRATGLYRSLTHRLETA